MRTALILYGSLRTFFMKMREYNDGIRVCDLLMKNIIEPNNPDIFISTDTDDFFYNGAQNFCSNQINILDNSCYRLNDKVNFLTVDESKNIIEKELKIFFGNRLKNIIISDSTNDTINDLKYKSLEHKISMGAPIANLVGQYRKIMLGRKLFENYEKENNIKYDCIAKFRPDAAYNRDGGLKFSNYDFINNDVYTAGHVPPIVYDWYGFGNRKGMIPYLKIYENLGFTLQNPVWIVECRYEGHHNYVGPDPMPHAKDLCKICHRNDRLEIANITLSSERHLRATFDKFGIICKISGYFAYVYRYRDISFDKSVGDVVKNELGLTNVTILNHTPTYPISKEDF